MINYLTVYPSAIGDCRIKIKNKFGSQIYSGNFRFENIGQPTEIFIGLSFKADSNYFIHQDYGSNFYSDLNPVSYPYTVTNSPITITQSYGGAGNPMSEYFNFYDWKISEGCMIPSSVARVLFNDAAEAVVISVNKDTICSGELIALSSIGFNPNPNFTWESNNGSGWVTETTISFNNPLYYTSATMSKSYRLISEDISLCKPSDTSNVLYVKVNPTPAAPTSASDSICGAGYLNLSANGVGQINWHTGSGISNRIVHIGNNYQPYLTTTTIFSVGSIIGNTLQVGLLDSLAGTSTISGFNFGLQFNVNNDVFLEKVHVYATGTGVLQFVISDSINNTICYYAANIDAPGKVPVYIGRRLNKGNNYRIKIGNSINFLLSNIGNASYPYTSASNNITITGYLNPTFNNDSLYYLYFYDWVMNDGCESPLTSVAGYAFTYPVQPVITQGNDTLFSSSLNNNQWYFNGNTILGATGNFITQAWAGTYTVIVTNPLTTCFTSSDPFLVTGVEQPGRINELIYCYPNPANHELNLMSQYPLQNGKITLFDLPGKIIFSSELAKGETQFKIDVSKLADAVYQIMITDEKIVIYDSKLVIIKN